MNGSHSCTAVCRPGKISQRRRAFITALQAQLTAKDKEITHPQRIRTPNPSSRCLQARLSRFWNDWLFATLSSSVVLSFRCR
jgi:hypothetical protein